MLNIQKRNIIISLSILLTIGLFFLSTATTIEAQNTYGDAYFFFKRQLLWILAGGIGFIITSKLNFHILSPKILYLTMLALLLAVFLPGIGNHAFGATRWLNLGPISIQPVEIVKPLCIMFFAKIFSLPQTNIKHFVLYSLPILGLIIIQPNMSNTILLATTISCQYFLSGKELKSLSIVALGMFLIASLLVVTSPYRAQRLHTLLSPDQDRKNQSYHVNQMLIAISSGGLLGKGIGNSELKYEFLPQVAKDSLVAVIAEETGILGIGLIVGLYVYLINSIFKLARSSSLPEYSLTASGIACLIGIQALINFSANVSLIPLTGIPLPLMSYGGSSMVFTLISLGLALQNPASHSTTLVYSSSEKKSQKNSSLRYSHHSYH